MLQKLDGGLNSRETSLMGLNAGRKWWWGSSLAHTIHTHIHRLGLPSLLLLTLCSALLHSSVPGAAKKATETHKKQIEMLHWVLSPHDAWFVRCRLQQPPPFPYHGHHPYAQPVCRSSTTPLLRYNLCNLVPPCKVLKSGQDFFGECHRSTHSFKTIDCPALLFLVEARTIKKKKHTQL